jgi:hypothetical protein
MSVTAAFRDDVVRRLREDLVGPISENEILSDRPSERYVTGILFPQGEALPQEENDTLPEGGEDDVPGEGATASDSVSLGYVVRPSSIAVSFAIEHDEPPELEIRVVGGRYEAFWPDNDTTHYASNAQWRRIPQLAKVTAPVFEEAHVVARPLKDDGVPGLSLRLRWSRIAKGRSILTVAVVNDAKVKRDKVANQTSAYFQAELRIRPLGTTVFVERPSHRAGEDMDLRLLYRDAHEYAVGHGCSADWDVDDGVVTEVRSCWIPEQKVASVSADGQKSCEPLKETTFSPKWLATASISDLKTELSRLPDLYVSWIKGQSLEAGAATTLKKQAEKHLQVCRDAAERMRKSIDLICHPTQPGHSQALAAFRFAMLAMNTQRRWARKEDLYWRPFQLGFQLLAFESLATTNHPDRELMDLLWFPTGGGKTEAYFGLIAFILFHRRLRHPDEPDKGAGTAVLMRYTLRLLTIQQFQRATRLICACEYVRKRESEKTAGAKLGETAFSIGLWVGGGATPNTVEEARRTISKDENPTAKQVTSCPCCNQSLRWSIYKRKGDAGERVRVKCENKKCDLGHDDEGHLPIWTVDEDIYNKRPSLLIGTIDKFTQIVRKPARTSNLFGRTENDPPDLILQDELHLISGPLGSLAGIYEMAIDELCTRRDASGSVVTHRPKIIGSTATIRAADTQVNALFARVARQFPPSELRAEDGFFTRRASEQEQPGRLYVGITSAGRSPKFALQALYASLLQSGRAVPAANDSDRDPWWTLIGYFNSLRELGGALVMLNDDVPVSVGIFARARADATERAISRVDELTSRKSQIELRDTLADLELCPCPHGDAFDAVLATNMISVGVDVDRLGMMAVTNQPKQMAEYIQATSRVGRRHPGLIVTLYNNNRARDRSHYESFRSWHQALYRDVEATSVTPLAPPARDKAVHAAIIALAAVQVHGLKSQPRLTPELRKELEAGIIKRLIARATTVDPAELPGFIEDVTRILDRWTKRSQDWERDGRWDLKPSEAPAYWMDAHDERSLLMSAEVEAAHRATASVLHDVFPTLNSLRNVEASSPFKMLEKIHIEKDEATDGD